MTLDDFDYPLPPELIAQHPPRERHASRLLVLGADGLADRRFAQLPDLLDPRDLVVFNDTKVLKARLFGVKDSGGRVELLVERIVDARDVLAHVRASHPPRAGATLRLVQAFSATVLGREGDLFRLRFESEALPLLERHGEVPLPPYIAHRPTAEDAERYQTVYARAPGAVAAPTAGLHFDVPLIEALRARGIGTAFLTLHVGAGTFQPVRTTSIETHTMHREWFELPEATIAAIEATRARGGKVVAVGTTSLRALEAAAREGPLRAGARETDLFIVPGFEFRVVDRLITNFHLPKSTLVMLVAAFAGLDRIRAAYAHAIAARYRFFSYGDAMLIDRALPPPALASLAPLRG